MRDFFILHLPLAHHLTHRGIFITYFINFALQPFGQPKKIFTNQLYNSRYTPIVCNEKTFLNFYLHILSIKKSSVHHLNTREIIVKLVVFLCAMRYNMFC